MANATDFKVKRGLVVSTTATILSTVNATSTTTGALIVAGGAGIAKDLLVTGTISALNSATTALVVRSNINMVSPDAASTITIRMLNSDAISFSGNSGQLFSITDSMTGTIFSVNDISGVPSIEVYDTGEVRLAETFGYVRIPNATSATSTATGALRVDGGVGIGGSLYVGGIVSANSFIGTLTGTVTTSTNLSGGATGGIPYQTAPGRTSFIGIGSIGQILQSNGTTATWVSTGSLIAGTAFTATTLLGGTAGQIHYQSAPGVTAFAGPGTAGQILVSAGTSAPVYTNTGSIYVGNSTRIDTTAQPANATYYPTFVDANNASAASEILHTTSSFAINPRTGNVGIGTASPGNKLTVAGNIELTSENSILFPSASIVKGGAALTFNIGSYYLRATQTGQVTTNGVFGVNTATPASSFQVVGDARITGITTVSNTTAASSTITGAFQVAGGVGVGGSLFVGGSTILGASAVSSLGSTSTVEINGGTKLYTGSSYSVTRHGTFAINVSTLGNFVSFATIGKTQAAAAYIELIMVEDNVGHNVMKYHILANYDDINNSTTSTVLPIYSTNPRAAGVGTYGSHIYELQATNLGAANGIGLRLLVRNTGTSVPSIYWTAILKNSDITETPNTTGIDTAVYSINRYTSITQYKSGTVGINTATPSVALDVVGSGKFSGGISVGGIVTATNTTSVSSTITGAFRVVGGVGIGGGLVVGGIVTATTFVGSFNGTVSTATSVLTSAQPANATYFPTFVDANNASAAAESLFTTSSFIINPGTGNVGIGTASPGARLEVLGNGDPTINTIALKVGLATHLPNTSTQQYGIYVDQKGGRYAPQTGIFVNVNNPNGLFGGPYYGIDTYVTSSSNAYQKAHGVSGTAENTSANYGTQAYGVKGLGLSSTGTGATIVANGQGAWGGHFTAYGNGNSVGVYADAYLGSSPISGATAIPLMVASNGVERMRVDAAGNVGISITSPASKLHVVGDARITGITTVTNNTAASSTITGAFQVVGGVGIGGNVYIGGNEFVAGTLQVNSTNANTATNTSNAFYTAGGAWIEKTLVVSGDTTFRGSVVFQGTNTFVYSSSTVYTDNLISLHAPVNSGPGNHTWTVDDGKDIGFMFHYYKGADRDAFLGFDNDTQFLEWFSNGAESGGVFTGTTYGTFRTGGIRLVDGASNSGNTTTGALQVLGGAGISGGLFVGGTVTATSFVGAFTGSIVGAATQVNTVRQTANATYFPTFVDSNNVSAGGESVYTTSSFVINPSTGNVGIGNASPTFKVDSSLGSVSNNITNYGYNIFADASGNVGYSGYSLQLNNSSGNATGFVRLARTSSTAYLGMEIQSQSRDGIRFLTSSTTAVEVARIDANGNVGIGTSTPAQVLDVRGWGRFGKAGNDAGIEFESGYGKIYRATASGNIIIDPQVNSVFLNGNVGIATTSPASKLHVVGDARITGITTVTNTTVATSTNTGAFQVVGGAGIGGALFVGGSVNITSGVVSTNTGTGALIVNGGVGINGALNAITKSFNISHPTKPGMNLRYGSLEGPEFGVYVRGRLTNSNVIELPEYWSKLINPDSITVNLTPIGSHQKLYVDRVVGAERIVLGNENLFGKTIDCFYTVYAERADIDPLVVEG